MATSAVKPAAVCPKEAEKLQPEPHRPPSRGGNNVQTVEHKDPRVTRENLERSQIIEFGPCDIANPHNWPTRRKVVIVAVGILTIFNGVFGSSLPSGAIDHIARAFGVTSKVQLVLPISVYQSGFVLGAFLFGPLSEAYGRQLVIIGPFATLTIFTVACALAPNWNSFLAFRLMCGVSASSAVSVTGGIYADIFDNPVQRGRANALSLSAIAIGPQFGPLVSGLVSPISWRRTFWIAAITAGLSFIPTAFLPETYGPVILQKRAKSIRQCTKDSRVYANIELEKRGIKHIAKIFLARPLRMAFLESIVLFTCLYLSYVSGIYYLFFEAYPIIFQGMYKMSPGMTGFTYIPVAAGILFGLPVFLYYDSFLYRARKRGASWASIQEYHRLPLACLGGPLCVISLFWLGWTSSTNIHWIVPTMSGLPFGLGFFLVFIALQNYVADAYKTFSASAIAAVSFWRSIGTSVLPLAASPMYHKLGVQWATTLLAFLSLGFCVVPFAFIKFRDRIRAGSKFCEELMQELR